MIISYYNRYDQYDDDNYISKCSIFTKTNITTDCTGTYASKAYRLGLLL